MQTATALTVAALLSTISCAWCSRPISFYPYGPGARDSHLNNAADPAVTLTLLDDYTFYGQEYGKLCLSDNGYITFQEPLTSNKPKPFPIKVGMEIAKGARMVAPYWSDVDTRCGGDIYYHQDRLDPTNVLYYIINYEVAYTGQGADFWPTSALIVTWEGVTCTNNVPCNDQRRNSIQLVLTTDGIRTFAMFRYKNLEWYAPYSQSSPSHQNLATGPATAGVNAGDQMNGFNVTDDPNDIIGKKLVSMTNVRKPGLFIYRLDLGPSARVKTFLMGKMMEAAVAETMQFGAARAEEELYSPYADIAASEFNRQPFAHHEEYVGGLTAETQSVYLYPYEDDDTLGKSDEGTSGIVYLPNPISYYGKTYDKLVVYTNGFLTLGGYYPTDLPTFLPRILKTTQVPIIAPYFADADSRESGQIHFRVTSDRSLLERASEDVNHVFHVDFSPKQLFIATWDSIGFYRSHSNLVNTYQVIIVSDDQTSYVIFIYKKVGWSSPDNSGVHVGSGIGAVLSKLPVLGISDGQVYEQLVKGSSEPRDKLAILNAASELGNTKVPGMWIFKANSDAHTKSDVNAQSPQQWVDGKMQYVYSDAHKNVNAQSPQWADGKMQHSDTHTNVNAQSPQWADGKIQYSEYHRPSRPYIDQQARSEIDSLASELQNAENSRSRG